MFTKTSKQILSSFSEIVEKLISILANAEAQGTPMPSLSHLGSSIQTQVESLIQVGQKIASNENADDELKKEMPFACQSALEASNLLMDSIKGLEIDALSSDYKTSLMDALKGLFNGTYTMLTVFDAADLRRIMICSDLIHSNVQIILSHFNTPLSQDDYISKVAIVSLKMMQLSELCQTRSKELLTQELEFELSLLGSRLISIGPFLLSASKIMLTFDKQLDVFDLLNTICQQILILCKRIEEIIHTNPHDIQSDSNSQVVISDTELASLDANDKWAHFESFALQKKQEYSKIMDFFQNPTHQQTLRDALDHLEKAKDINELTFSLQQTQDTFYGILITELGIWELEVNDMIHSFKGNPQSISLSFDLIGASIQHLKERARKYTFLQLELEMACNHILNTSDIICKIVKLYKSKLTATQVYNLHSNLLIQLQDQVCHLLNLSIREHGLFDLRVIINAKAGILRYALDAFLNCHYKDHKRLYDRLQLLSNDFMQSCMCLDHHHTAVKEYIIDITYLFEQLDKLQLQSKIDADKRIEIIENLKIISSLLPMILYEQEVNVTHEKKDMNTYDSNTKQSKDIVNTVNDHHLIQGSIKIVSHLLSDMANYQCELESSQKLRQQSLKNLLIQTAQSILKESMKINQSAQFIASLCKDKILEKELKSILIKIDTISHQLRIVTAVKASNPLDTDSSNQMNQCTRNLVHSLDVCFQTCQIIENLGLNSK